MILAWENEMMEQQQDTDVVQLLRPPVGRTLTLSLERVRIFPAKSFHWSAS